MIYIIVALIVLALMFDTRKKSEEVEGSKYFYVSDGASKDMYLRMHADGMHRDMLKRFVYLEDRLLEIEKLSVCSGIPRIVEASLISNKIKEIFPKYNFAYHTIHLKQVAEPNKYINLVISCQ
jgi:hypothetical protein